MIAAAEKAIAPYSSTLAWKIPWIEEPSRLQSMGSLRVRHDWATSHSLFTFMHWRRKWQPTPVFLPRESQGRGSLVGCRLWDRKSQTRLKQLSSSSSCLDSSPGKESTCNVGDLDLIPGLGRSPGERKIYPLQYLGLENSMNCIVHGVTNSGTWLKKFHFTLPLEMCYLCMVLKMCSNIFQYL